MQDEAIRGGYILLARKLFDSWLMDKPPLYWKMWIWMLGQANWKDRGQLKKGQLVTTTAEMQEAMSYRIGYRKKTPTRAEIRSSYEAFTNNHMISHTKSTRGMVVTVENFGKYQDFRSYEQHNEQPREDTTNNQAATQDTESIRKQENRKKKTKPFTPPSVQEVFDYCQKRGNGIDAKMFIDSYEAKGWMIGKNKMKDWKAAVRTWEGRRKGDRQSPRSRKSKMDVVEDRLNRWAGGSNVEGVGKENDSGDDNGPRTIELEKLATGQFGR